MLYHHQYILLIFVQKVLVKVLRPTSLVSSPFNLRLCHEVLVRDCLFQVLGSFQSLVLLGFDQTIYVYVHLKQFAVEA